MWTHTQCWELRSGPWQSPPSRAWSTGPAKGSAENRRLQPEGGVDATSRIGSHAGLCAPTPGSPSPQPPRAPGPPVCPQAPAGGPPGDATRRQTPVGHQAKPNPAHTHTLATPQVSRHRLRQHPQHPRSPAPYTARHASTRSQRSHHLSPIPSQSPPLGATPSPVQKTPSEPQDEGRQHARQRAPLRQPVPNPSPQLSKPPNPAEAAAEVEPEPHPVISNP